MYDAVSHITPAVPFTLSQLGILTMRHILAVFMFDVSIFIHSPRVTYYSKAVFMFDVSIFIHSPRVTCCSKAVFYVDF